jgi:hypothetical protein
VKKQRYGWDGARITNSTLLERLRRIQESLLIALVTTSYGLRGKTGAAVPRTDSLGKTESLSANARSNSTRTRPTHFGFKSKPNSTSPAGK